MTHIDLISSSRKLFFGCVAICNDHLRSGHGFQLYREIIDMHRETPDLDKLLKRDGFIPLVRQTLVAWNMNQRGASLATEDEMKRSIERNKLGLTKLCRYKLHQLNGKVLDNVVNLLELVFVGLKVMRSKRRIVGVSKALHFLLPDLVMPIDGKYTLEAFYGRNRYSSNLQKETDDFVYIFRHTFQIAKKLNLTDADVSGSQWNTSIPKLIDNAIIGLIKFRDKELTRQSEES